VPSVPAPGSGAPSLANVRRPRRRCRPTGARCPGRRRRTQQAGRAIARQGHPLPGEPLRHPPQSGRQRPHRPAGRLALRAGLRVHPPDRRPVRLDGARRDRLAGGRGPRLAAHLGRTGGHRLRPRPDPQRRRGRGHPGARLRRRHDPRRLVALRPVRRCSSSAVPATPVAAVR
jgi:hypothetical protein